MRVDCEQHVAQVLLAAHGPETTIGSTHDPDRLSLPNIIRRRASTPIDRILGQCRDGMVGRSPSRSPL
jgi:hypothetical protein